MSLEFKQKLTQTVVIIFALALALVAVFDRTPPIVDEKHPFVFVGFQYWDSREKQRTCCSMVQLRGPMSPFVIDQLTEVLSNNVISEGMECKHLVITQLNALPQDLP